MLCTHVILRIREEMLLSPGTTIESVVSRKFEHADIFWNVLSREKSLFHDLVEGAGSGSWKTPHLVWNLVLHNGDPRDTFQPCQWRSRLTFLVKRKRVNRVAICVLEPWIEFYETSSAAIRSCEKALVRFRLTLILASIWEIIVLTLGMSSKLPWRREFCA